MPGSSRFIVSIAGELIPGKVQPLGYEAATTL